MDKIIYAFSTKYPQKGSICGEMIGTKVIAISRVIFSFQNLKHLSE